MHLSKQVAVMQGTPLESGPRARRTPSTTSTARDGEILPIDLLSQIYGEEFFVHDVISDLT